MVVVRRIQHTISQRTALTFELSGRSEGSRVAFGEHPQWKRRSSQYSRYGEKKRLAVAVDYS